MTMRIAIGQVWQETNSFNPLPTTRTDFEQFGVYRGDDLVARMASTNELGGFIQSLRSWPERPEIVGLVRLPAWPSGPATRATFEWLRHEFLESLSAAGTVDALLLALHGAMAAEDHPDVEGELLAAIRARVGPNLPVVATLDLHANVTQEMVTHATVLVPYHTMPHVDIFETGQRAARVLHRILYVGARPVTAFQKMPAVVPAERSSTEAASGPAADFKRQLQALEADSSVLACGLLPVQPWLDVPQLGASVLVTTDGQPPLAQAACRELAQSFWQRRQEYICELHSIGDAVRLAAELAQDGLIVLSDPADATTSGAPGDSVWLLAELLQYDWPRPVLVPLVAPDIVRQAELHLGKGPSTAAIPFKLGGVRDSRFGTTITVPATVEKTFRAEFVMSGHIGRQLPIDMGPSAVLCHDQIRLVVTSRSGPHFAPELFRTAGYDPFAAAVVVAKSPCGFRAVYESRARAIFSVRAPGCAPPDFWNYEYRQMPRPLWPWDDILDWQPDPHI
ncbi:MAG: M81 family metallopeptidase, partial [Pirellulaceae bacterium]